MEEVEVPMRMYRNLEEVFVEEDSPRKPRSQLSASSIAMKTSALSKYYN